MGYRSTSTQDLPSDCVGTGSHKEHPRRAFHTNRSKTQQMQTQDSAALAAGAWLRAAESLHSGELHHTTISSARDLVGPSVVAVLTPLLPNLALFELAFVYHSHRLNFP